MQFKALKADKALLSAFLVAGLLAGCGGGGDINIAPQTADNSVDNSTTTNAPVETANLALLM